MSCLEDCQDFNFQPWQMKALAYMKPKDSKLLLLSQSQDIGKGTVASLSTSGALSLLTSLPQGPPIPQWWGSEEVQGLDPIPLLNLLGKTALQVGNESFCVLSDTGATLSFLPTLYEAVPRSLPQSSKIVQEVGISSISTGSCLCTYSFLLRPLKRQTDFSP